MSLQKFTAKLVKDAEQGGWTKIDIPFDVENVFSQSGYVKVKGTIDKHAYNGIKLMPIGDGSYCMAIKETIRKAIGKGNGDTVQMTMEPDMEELIIPTGLLEGLDSNPKAKAFFKSLTESNKNYFVEWINSGKREETRNDRIVKSIEKLQAGRKFHE